MYKKQLTIVLSVILVFIIILPVSASEDRYDVYDYHGGIPQTYSYIYLEKPDMAVNVETETIISAQDENADFYFNDGKIICTNEAKIGISSKNPNMTTVLDCAEPICTSFLASETNTYIVKTKDGSYGIFNISQVAENTMSIYLRAVDSKTAKEALSSAKIPASSSDKPDTVSADGKIRVFVNCKQVSFDVYPDIIDGRLLVPIRAIAESMNMEVTWVAETKTAILKKGEKEVKLTVGSKTSYVDGKKVELDVPASSIGGRTMLPLRFLSESMGYSVSWDGKLKKALISENSIIEWRYDGYDKESPYEEYDSLYVNGDQTASIRYTGNYHKFVTLYNADGRIAKDIPEEDMAKYGDGWSTEAPKPKEENHGTVKTEGQTTDYISPDGKKAVRLVYTRGNSAESKLYFVDYSSNTSTEIMNNPAVSGSNYGLYTAIEYVAWTPDSSKFVVWAQKYAYGRSGYIFSCSITENIGIYSGNGSKLFDALNEEYTRGTPHSDYKENGLKLSEGKLFLEKADGTCLMRSLTEGGDWIEMPKP